MRDSTRYEQVHDTGNGYKYLHLGSGRRVTFSDASKEANLYATHLSRWLSRMVKLAGTHKYAEYDWREIEMLVDRMEAMTEFYRKKLSEELEKRTRQQNKRERIAALRNVSGRTPEEAAIFLAKADRLEAELD